MLPESGAGNPVVLAGEPPDPARIPPGCRFHPRCQVRAAGEATALGLEARCTGVDLPILPGSSPTAEVACHVALARRTTSAAAPPGAAASPAESQID